MGSRLWRWRAIVRVAADVTTFVFILVFFIFSFVLLKRIPSPRMGFYCDDISIRYPFKESTVPDLAVMIAVIVVPLFTLVVGGLYEHFVLKREQGPSLSCGCSYKIPEWPLRILNWVFVMIVTLGLTEVLTGLGKQMGGQLRPHFIAVCQPNFSEINCTDAQGLPQYVTDYECMGDPNDVIEARLSWPSGHASASAASLTFTALYLLSLPILYKRSLVQITAVAFCFFAAIICGLTRVTDFHHHTFDVISGLILGFSIAFATGYFQLHLFGHLKGQEGIVDGNLRRGSAMSHVFYRRTTLTGEEDIRDCEDVEETDKGRRGGAGGGEEKKVTTGQAWEGVAV